MDKVDNRIGSVDTSVRIIKTLESNGRAGITELADTLGVSKSTVFNHLWTLEDNEFVVRDDDQFHLSLRFLELGKQTQRDVGLYRVGKPLIDDLAAETSEVANIMVPENNQGVYLYKALGDKAIKHDTRPGKRICLHCTALGKSILSKMPSEDVEVIVKQYGLMKKTDNTITDQKTLYKELADIQEQGYAINVGERNERVCCIGAPIHVHGDVRGAISVSTPKMRMEDPDYEAQIAEQVQETANVIEINLEYK